LPYIFLKRKFTMQVQFLKMAAAAAMVAALYGCGSSDSPPPAQQVALSDVSVAISPTTASAATAALTSAGATGFTFPNGVAALGTTASTVIKITGSGATPDFSVTSGSQTASGKMSYGSCIFTASISNIPGFPVGVPVTITPCTYVANTTGALSGSTVGVGSSLTLGSTRGNGPSITVTIGAGGVVTVGGVQVGTIATGSPTGGAS
jgi:hypothetical protein